MRRTIRLIESVELYHGSPNTNIDKLRIGKEKTTGNEFGTGIYLTSNKSEAEGYAGNQGKVYKVLLDDTNLYNLSDSLTNSMKSMIKEDLINNERIKNQILANNRKFYKVEDKQEGQKFYNQKKSEWEEKDNIFLSNAPKVTKNNEQLYVIYTDYNSIDEAIDKLNGEKLQHILTGDIDPDVFVSIIIKSGFDGIIAHNGEWYILYKNEDKVKIV